MSITDSMHQPSMDLGEASTSRGQNDDFLELLKEFGKCKRPRETYYGQTESPKRHSAAAAAALTSRSQVTSRDASTRKVRVNFSNLNDNGKRAALDRKNGILQQLPMMSTRQDEGDADMNDRAGRTHGSSQSQTQISRKKDPWSPAPKKQDYNSTVKSSMNSSDPK